MLTRLFLTTITPSNNQVQVKMVQLTSKRYLAPVLLNFAFVLNHSSSGLSLYNQQRCIARPVEGDPTRIVCVCNEDTCDDLEFQWPAVHEKVTLVQSTQAGKRFQVSDLSQQNLTKHDNRLKATQVRLNLNDQRQSILGWGGAFTDATGFNLINLTSNLADRLISSYYGANGLQYNFGRVPIAGTDFSTRPYSYDDANHPDYKLKSWNLATEDKNYKIPFIKKAIKEVEGRGEELKLFASPWSPPSWMKTNNKLVRGSLIDNDATYKSYTNYLMKFYDSYKENGINFWGATVQNEPLSSYYPFYFFNSLQMSNRQMIKFITEYLGPALWKRGYTKDNFKLIVGDDSLGLVDLQVPAIMRNKEVQKYISGFAYHWYFSGIMVPYTDISRIYDSIKDSIEFVMMSEACMGPYPFGKKVDLGSWDRGEAYATDIVNDFKHHTNAWIDWNMALDMSGGPNWSKNLVDSPILVDSQKKEFYKQPTYYFLAHFTRFFKPESRIVQTEVKSNRFFISRLKEDILVLACYNNQTSHVVVNVINKAKENTRVEITIDGIENHVKAIPLNSFVAEARSINTVVMKI